MSPGTSGGHSLRRQGSRNSLGSANSSAHTLIGQSFIDSTHYPGDAPSMAYSDNSGTYYEPSFHDSEGSMPSLADFSSYSENVHGSPMPSLASFSDNSPYSTSSGTNLSRRAVGVSPRSITGHFSASSLSSFGYMSSSSTSVSVTSRSSSVPRSAIRSSSSLHSRSSHGSRPSHHSRSSSKSSSGSSRSASKDKKEKAATKTDKKTFTKYDDLLMMVERMHGSGSSFGLNDSTRSLTLEAESVTSSKGGASLHKKSSSRVVGTPRSGGVAYEHGSSADYISSPSSSMRDSIGYMVLKRDNKKGIGSAKRAGLPSQQGRRGSLSSHSTAGSKGKSHASPTEGRRGSMASKSSCDQNLKEADEKKRHQTRKQQWQALLSKQRMLDPKINKPDTAAFHESTGSMTIHSSVASVATEHSRASSAITHHSTTSMRSVEETKELMDRLDGSSRSASRRLYHSASPIRRRLEGDDLTQRSTASIRLDRIRSPRRRHQLLSKQQQQSVSTRSTVTTTTSERLSISKLMEGIPISDLEEMGANSDTATLPPLPTPMSPSTSSTSFNSGLPPIDPRGRTVRTGNRSIFEEKPRRRRISRPRPLSKSPLLRNPPVLPPGGLLAAFPDLPFDSASSSSYTSTTSSKSSYEELDLSGRRSLHSVDSGATEDLPRTPLSPRRWPHDSFKVFEGSTHSFSSASSGETSGATISDCGDRRRSRSRHRSRSPKEGGSSSSHQSSSRHKQEQIPTPPTRRKGSVESNTTGSGSTYILAPINLEIPKTPSGSNSSGRSTIAGFFHDDSSVESTVHHTRHNSFYDDHSNYYEHQVSSIAVPMSPVMEEESHHAKQPNEPFASPIWGRLEEEKKRQQKLRQRLRVLEETKKHQLELRELLIESGEASSPSPDCSERSTSHRSGIKAF